MASDHHVCGKHHSSQHVGPSVKLESFPSLMMSNLPTKLQSCRLILSGCSYVLMISAYCLYCQMCVFCRYTYGQPVPGKALLQGCQKFRYFLQTGTMNSPCLTETVEVCMDLNLLVFLTNKQYSQFLFPLCRWKRTGAPLLYLTSLFSRVL